MIYCDPDTGTCTLSRDDGESVPADTVPLDRTILYFGDPMCSWCWGLAPEIEKLTDHFADTLSFKLVMGGLRVDDHIPWDSRMKNYLRNHWEQVSKKSGQPFSYELFEREKFNYNTEPSCRAVKVAEDEIGDESLDFYHGVQHRFYAENHDPNQVSFYRPLCQETGISYDRFKSKFQSERFRNRTAKDIQFTRQLGVSAFPTVLLSMENELAVLARGYTPFDLMILRAEEQLGKTSIDT